MKFRANDNLINLMVGQLVYTSSATPVRELLQNAYDACALQSVDHPDFKSSIQVAISRADNWFEVQDNGIGMDQTIVEESFSMVGRPKTEITAIRELIQRGGPQATQIATFGIGVLSCFRIAQKVTVSTKMDGKDPIKFVIYDPQQDFQMLVDSLRSERGTSVKVDIKPGVDFTANDAYNAVFYFARHVEGLQILNADNGSIQSVSQKYDGDIYPMKKTLQNEDIRYGIIALNDAWEKPNATWSNTMRLDNAGFVIQDHDQAMLPQYCFGYTTEIDFVPQRLQLMINREKFVQDAKYYSIRSFLLQQYLSLVESRIKNWVSDMNQDPKGSQQKAMLNEHLMILEHNLPADQICQPLKAFATDTIEKYVEFPIYSPIPKQLTLEQAKGMSSNIYVYHSGRTGAQHFTETYDEETTIQITRQTLTSERIKANLLTLQGKPVFLISPISKIINTQTGNYSLGYDFTSFLNRYCQSRGLSLLSVAQVPESDIRLQDTKLTDIMSAILNYPKTLKFMALKGIGIPTFRDIDDSYWVNIDNPEIRSLMRSVPEMVGNPIKKELLLIYFDLLTIDFASARKRMEKLLIRNDFVELSMQKSGVFQERFLRVFLLELAGIEASTGG